METRNLSAYPRIRLGITLALTVIIGVLSSILASQLMPGGELDWKLLPKLASFWLLLATTIVWLAIQIAYLNSDNGLLVYADDLHCDALIRKMKLVAIADDLKKHPEKGHALSVTKLRNDLGIQEKLKQKGGQA